MAGKLDLHVAPTAGAEPPERESPTSSSKPSWRTGLLWALAILAGAASLVGLGVFEPEPLGPYFGTRLGMSESAVRSRFVGANDGTFAESQDQALHILRWTPGAAHSELPDDATFEFKDDRLVAIRADVPSHAPLASGPDTESLLYEVVARRPGAHGAVRLTVLSRNCSEHLAEAAALLASRPSHEIPKLVEP